MEQKRNVLIVIADALRAANSQLGESGPTMFSIMADYFEGGYEASEKGQFVAWTNYGMPSELYWAMDIYPLVMDLIAGYPTGWAPPLAMHYIDLAHEHVPHFICGQNKSLLGLVLSGDVALPDIMVIPSNPCDSNLSIYPAIAGYADFPCYVIFTPYFYLNERSIEYITNEWRKLVSILEEKTGRKLDLDRLRQVIRYSNVAHEHMNKLAKLKEGIPCPYPSLDTMMEMTPPMGLAGTPQLADYFKMKYEITKSKVDSKEALTNVEEKIRLIWSYGSVAFDPTFMPWLEQEYGAVTVCMLNTNWIVQPMPIEDTSSLDHILRGLAKNMVVRPMTRECHGPWENWAEATLDMGRRYKADAVIFGGHVACKASWAAAKLMKDRVREELGIPTLNVELDMFDARVVSGDQVRARFADFFESLEPA